MSPLYRLSRFLLEKCFGLYWPVSLRGRVPDGPLILAGNHPSVLDGLLMALIVPRRVHFLIRADVMAIPLLGGFLRAMGYIPVASGNGCLEAAGRHLQRGGCVAIFPESEPTATLELREFRRGLAVMAQESGAPVLPFAILGTERICRPDARYVPPGRVDVRLGNLLYKPADEDVDAFRDRVRTEVEGMLKEPGGAGRPATWWLPGLVIVPLSAFLLALSHLTRPRA